MMNKVYEGEGGGEEPFVGMGVQDQRNHYYRDSQFRSAPDISDHGLPILSIISSPLIVGRFFSRYEVIHTVCIQWNPFLTTSRIATTVAIMTDLQIPVFSFL